MTVDELRQALEAHDPDPGVVLARVSAEQRRRRHVRLVTSVAVAVVVVLISVVVAVAVHHPNPRSGLGGDALTDGCAVIPLGTVFTTAQQQGASIISGNGGLTGVTATGPDGLEFYQFRIRTFTRLAGAPFTAQIAWIPSTPAARRPPGTTTSPGITARPGAMWSSDGSFFAIVWPTSETHNGVGPQLAIQPYQNGSVIYALGQCPDDLSGISSTPYTGAFAQLPGEHSNTIAQEEGLRAVKLDVITSLLK